jgi:hypothetical protein
MPKQRLPLLPARNVPWTLKPFSSAETSLDYDGYGRMKLFIRHDVVHGCTPAMVHWWFENIGGDMDFEGATIPKYLAWHPVDHIHWALDRPARGGGAGVGARFRIVEAFMGNPDFYIDVVETVIRLDQTGITLCNRMLGAEVTRLNHDFIEVPDGTLYLSTLTVGFSAPVLRQLNPFIHSWIFSEEMGRAWLRHNVEEVGALEHLVPLLQRGHRAGSGPRPHP